MELESEKHEVDILTGEKEYFEWLWGKTPRNENQMCLGGNSWIEKLDHSAK